MESKEVAIREPETKSIAEVKAHTSLVHQVLKDIMKRGVHYDKIPGCGDKPALLKPGAEKIILTFRIAVDPVIEDLSSEDEVRYRIICRGNHQVTGYFLGAGVGECSSNEEKFKWRKAVCKEEWDDTPEDRRRMKWKKKFKANAYQVMQVRENPADVANTVLKMAKKRGAVDMVLTITAASDIFTQDIEENPDKYRKEETPGPATEQPQALNLNTIIGFGKHKEETWGSCPLAYLQWLAKTDGSNAKNAQAALKLREGIPQEAKPPTGKPIPTYTVKPGVAPLIFDIHKDGKLAYHVNKNPGDEFCSCAANPNKGECKHFGMVNDYIANQPANNPAKPISPVDAAPATQKPVNGADKPATPAKLDLICAYVSKMVVGMQIKEARETLPEDMSMGQAVELLNYLIGLKGEIECPEWVSQVNKVVST